MRDRFHSSPKAAVQVFKPPTPQWSSAMLVDNQSHATEHTSSVPDDIYDEEDSRSCDDSASDEDSMFSGEMDIVEDDSDTTSPSAMNVSAKEALSAVRPPIEIGRAHV